MLRFPIPAAVLVLENGVWVDYVSGLFVVLINVFLLTALLLFSVLGTLLLRFLTRKRDTKKT